jgi:hypothetical protein
MLARLVTSSTARFSEIPRDSPIIETFVYLKAILIDIFEM